MNTREQIIADSQRQVTILRDALKKFLSDNDPEGFGCACEPNHLCGPCSERQRQQPLYEALAATEPKEYEMNEATARNIRVQNRYNELITIGKHNHYETMFQVIREETTSLHQQLTALSDLRFS